jgi:hypothetical protein
MSKARTFARPNKALGVFEEVKDIGKVDPVWIVLDKQSSGLAIEAVSENELQRVLQPIQSLNRQVSAVPTS